MRWLIHAGFWSTAIALMIMVLCLAIPLWLGSIDSTTKTKIYYALFYHIYCGTSDCQADDTWLDSENVQLKNRQWDVDILVVPILAIVSTCLCAIGLFFLELLHCRCNTLSGTRTFLIVVLLLLLSSGPCGEALSYVCGVPYSNLFLLFHNCLLHIGVLGTIAMFLSYYMADEYYKDHPISGPEVFPWAIFFMTIAVVFVLIASVIYMIVVCKWSKYRDYFYVKKTWYVNRSDEENFHFGKTGNGNIHRDLSVDIFRDDGLRYVQGQPFLLERKSKTNKKLDKRFSRSYDNLDHSYRSKRNVQYLRERTSKKNKIQNNSISKSYDNLASTNYNSSHFIPKILRGSSMPDYINEEQSGIRETRYMKNSGPYASNTSLNGSYTSLTGSYTALVISPSTRHSITRLSRSDPSHLASSTSYMYD